MPITLGKIAEKDITVGIIGLGYVGYPLALVFAEAGVEVIGFDVDQSKIESIENKKSYIIQYEDSRLERVVSDELFTATDDFSKVEKCDAIVICVPTPLDHHLEPNLQYIEATCNAIAPHLSPHTLISLESTTWPGTTKEVVQEILERKSTLRVDQDLYLSFSPEREDPGNPYYNTKTIPKLVGGINQESLELAVDLYSLAIDEVISAPSTQVAESAKLLENIFRSVNIALVNELKVIFDAMGINVWDVIKAASTKPFGYMPFWPGPGLGGHCIPIDPYYLTWKAKEHGITTRFIELAGEINRAMPKWVVNRVQDCLNEFGKPLKGTRILLLGLAYKENVADIRESPSLELIDIMEDKGAVVDFHDPFVGEISQTREYGHLAGRRHQELSDDYDCFILATAHKNFKSEKILSYGVPVVDTRHFLPTDHELVFSA